MAQMYGKYLLIRIKEKDQKPAQKTKRKKDARQGISNPRYYENALTTKQAGINRELDRIDILRI